MTVSDRSLRRGRVRRPRARLRIRWRYARLHTLLPVLRWLALAGLLVSVTTGGLRWISAPEQVGALSFTPHLVNSITNAEGVRDVAVADLDGDGDRDIATSGQDGIKIYENKGSFNFEMHLIDDQDGERIQLVNLDSDDDLDMLVAVHGNSPSVRWYENVGGFNFTTRTIATAGSDAVTYAGDINNDGWADIVTASNVGGSITLERWINNQDDTFTATTLSSDSSVEALTVGDLNGNNYADIVTGGEDGLQHWDTSNGTTWTRADLDDSNANRTHLSLGDPNTGGTWIASADGNVNEVVIYRSGPTGSSSATYGRLVINTGIDAKSITARDLDGDNNLDLLVTAEDDNSVYWYENDGADHFTKHTLATGLQSVYGVAVGDVDGDGDEDFVTVDQRQGFVYVYERLLVKPVAGAPTNISQSTAGTGVVTFETELSDGDKDASRIRVQYSTDGDHWYKPWLTKVKVDNGSVDLKNSNDYQVGSVDPIDTHENDNVTVTLTWDAKSSNNTGGPISGDVGSVRLRIIPRDDREVGVATATSAFRVDNAAPTGLGNVQITSINESEATLTWDRPVDSSTFTYKLYYGTNRATVLDQKAELWDGTDDEKMNDIDSTTTTVTGLTANQTYIFKLFVTDTFGNNTGAPSVQGTSSGSAETPTPTVSPTGTPTPTPSGEPTPTPTVSPTATPSPTVPPVLQGNQAPEADGGPDQVVNPRALVILDGTSSFDSDPGDTATLVYSWRQLSGSDVELISDRSATASFSAGEENETYIFSLTVRDLNGASSTDTVTIATKALPPSDQTLVKIDSDTPTPGEGLEGIQSPLVSRVLQPADLVLFVLSLLSTVLLLAERAVRGLREGARKSAGAASTGDQGSPQGRVVHHRTGTPIAGAQVLVYDSTGKLRAQERTNDQGVFPTFFPVGQYTLGIKVEGFTFAPTAAKTVAPPDSILYTGGKLTVKDQNKPLAVVIPMKPTTAEVSSSRVRLLHGWQSVQRIGRALSWPLFLAGALLNTSLVFLSPRFMFLAIEVAYIALVVMKIALEVRTRPAYGQVRNAITHIPIDLAVVRLFEAKTNRLVMTRVANNQGRFFALPPAGVYTVTISKPGYATFTKENLEIKSERDTTLQMTADLMPVAPQGIGTQLAQAPA